jgi:transposase-like protein
MKAPKTLLEAIKYFSDELTCINAVALMVWPDGVKCPHCVAADPYWLETQKRWKCRQCRKQFSVKVNTIFEDSPLSLTKWLPALWLLVNCKNGVSSYEIARDLGISQKSAWFMLQRLRLALKVSSFSAKKAGDDGCEVEVDETFIGGRARNMHKAERERKITGTGGVMERGGKVHTQVIEDRLRKTVRPIIKEFAHEMVNHAVEYVARRVHTNGLENFWSLVKRGLNGTYVSVEPFHLFRYLDEQCFRFNNRATEENPLDDADRFLLALSQVANKRLTFKEVTGKLGSTATC